MTAWHRRSVETNLASILLAAGALWTCLFIVLYLIARHQQQHELLDLATTEARAAYQKDLSYRLWNSLHGGVYVPITPTFQPNPYLRDITNRDVTTTAGQRLTLVNPAFMTRLVHELGHKEFGLKAHITSLKPLSPANQPDPWEATALRRLETGPERPKEIAEIADLGGERHLRFMAPLTTREQCLKCHAAQGYKVGDIRGGLSVSVPLDRAYFPGAVGAQRSFMLGFAGVWCLGLAGLGLVGVMVQNRRVERQEALARLQESEERLRLALDAGRMGAWDWDLSNDRLQWTPEHERLFGLEPGTFDGSLETFNRCLHPDDREGVLAVLERARQAGEGCNLEFRVVRPDGSVHFMHAQGDCTKDAAGRASRMTGIVREITAQRLSEASLRERETRYRSVVETSVDGFWLVDLEGRILEVNQSYVKLSGYSREELLQMRVWDLDATESADSTAMHIQKVLSQGSDLFEARHRRKDGTVWLVEVNAAFWPSAEGRLFAFLRNINERKRAEHLLLTRLRLTDLADRASMDQVMQAALDACELLTGSNIGFFHFVDPDQKHLTLQAWSTNTLKHMCKAEGKGSHYAIDQAGVWVDCFHTRAPVIHNDYAHLAHRKGMPEGHAQVVRELVVPIIREGVVKAIFGVGNKTTDYTQEDAEAAQLLASITMDVVIRKQTEEQLRAEEAKFRSYVTHAPVGVLVANRLGRHLEANPAAEALLGYEPGGLVNTHVHDVAHPADAAIAAEHFQRVLREGFADGVLRLRRRDGQPIPVAVRAVRLGEDFFMAIYLDITERLKAEAALRESEARYRKLFNDATEGIALADAETGELLDVNEAFTRMLKRSREELVGRHQRTLHPVLAQGKEFSQSFSRHRAEGHDEVLPELMLTGANEVIEVEIKAQILQLDGRKVVQGFFRDSTERLRAERERERLNQELDRKNRELQNVLFAASHDLRSPLLNVQGHTHRMEQACRKLIPLLEPKALAGEASARQALAILQDEVPKSAAFVRNGVEKMDTLISGMLRLSRLGQVMLHPQPLDMNRLLEGTIASLALQVEEAAATIRLDPLPTPVGDFTLIGQVFSNLIDNAIKYRDRTRPLVVSITGNTEGGQCVFCVEDNGIGIPADKAERIWELFGRLAPTAAPGDGLGLNLVKRIMDRHGGSIQVEPAPGVGCRFLVCLPAAKSS